MPTSDSGESRRVPMKPHGVTGASTEQQEQFPCPRCDSTNTKFCYYNNYNFSQPRHFCKSCRRYCTHGGTLRDIPIGGASRKSAKRTRIVSSSTSSGICSVPSVLFPPSSISNGVSHTVTDNNVKGSALSLCGSFTSLLNHNTSIHGSGSVIGLSGLGLGFDDVSFGFGRSMWPFSTVCDTATTNVSNHGGQHMVPIPATWQLESLDSSTGGYVSGEYFAWPDLSITTPRTLLK